MNETTWKILGVLGFFFIFWLVFRIKEYRQDLKTKIGNARWNLSHARQMRYEWEIQNPYNSNFWDKDYQDLWRAEIIAENTYNQLCRSNPTYTSHNAYAATKLRYETRVQ